MTLHNPAIHFHQFANLFQLNEYLPAEKAEDFEFETKKSYSVDLLFDSRLEIANYAKHFYLVWQ